MTTTPPEAIEDVQFEPEYHIKDVMRDLMQLLEQFDPIGCLKCNHLKCCCSPSVSSYTKVTISRSDSGSSSPEERDRSMDVFYNVAPPPETLPTPKWPENKTNDRKPQKEKPSPKPFSPTEKWVKASTSNSIESSSNISFPVPKKVLHEVNYSWPPFPKSIWSKEMLRETLERENTISSRSEENGNNSVEAFFRYFGRKRPVPKTAFAC